MSMIIRISVVLYAVAAIIHFISQDIHLACISILFLMITLGLSLWMSYLPVRLLLKQQRQTAKHMERDGVSEEKILAYIDQAIDESQYSEVPKWMYWISTAGVMGSVIMLVIGLFNLT